MKKIFTLGLLILSATAQAAGSSREMKFDFDITSDLEKVPFYQNGKLTYGQSGYSEPVIGANCSISGPISGSYPAGTSFIAVIGSYSASTNPKLPQASEDKKSARLELYPTNMVRSFSSPAEVSLSGKGIAIDCESSKEMSTEDFLALIKKSLGSHLTNAPENLAQGLIKWEAFGEQAYTSYLDQALVMAKKKLKAEDGKLTQADSRSGVRGDQVAQAK